MYKSKNSTYPTDTINYKVLVKQPNFAWEKLGMDCSLFGFFLPLLFYEYGTVNFSVTQYIANNNSGVSYLKQAIFNLL